MEVVEIEVKSRAARGKNALKVLRREGTIPGVLYSDGTEAIAIEIDSQHFRRQTAGKTPSQLYRLKGDSEQSNEDLTLIKDIQVEPLKSIIQHIDFCRVTAGTKITVSVPIKLTGESVSIKNSGGIVNQLFYEIEVNCLPREIPSGLELDITELEVGGVLQVKNVSLPDGVELVSSEDIAVVSGVAKRAAEVEPEAEESAAEGEAAGAEGGEAPAADAENKDSKDKE